MIKRFICFLVCVLLSVPAFAATCTSGKYTAPNGTCQLCSAIASNLGSAWGELVQTCGGGTLTCKPGSFKAQYSNTMYYCYPCPAQLNKQTGEPNIPSSHSWSTLSDDTTTSDNRCLAYSDTKASGEHCTTRQIWTPVQSGDCSDITGNTIPVRSSPNQYSFSYSCTYAYNGARYIDSEPGYGITSLNSGNSCIACTDSSIGNNLYCPGGSGSNALRHVIAPNSQTVKTNGLNTGWECKAGFYKTYWGFTADNVTKTVDYCAACPCYGLDGDGHGHFDLYSCGTTSAGATSISQCTTDVGAIDGSGVYFRLNCYYSGGGNDDDIYLTNESGALSSCGNSVYTILSMVCPYELYGDYEYDIENGSIISPVANQEECINNSVRYISDSGGPRFTMPGIGEAQLFIWAAANDDSACGSYIQCNCFQ